MKTATVVEPPETNGTHEEALRTTQAVVVHQRHEVGQALTPSQITERLNFIKQVMAENMKQGTDYGKVPGCGDKPGLFQPGAQKLSMTFQLNPEVLREEVTDYPNYHRGYRLVIRVTNGSKFADGVGECSTLEAKYRYRGGARKCPKCGGAFIIKGKQEYGGGWICFSKKGGCGAKFGDNAPEIVSQSETKVEHDNPPDHWNTARKMAFKRGFVHAIINATNTSELWSQDLEDLASNGVTRDHDDDNPGAGGSPSSTARARANTPPTARTSPNPVPPREAPAKPETRAKEVRHKAATDEQIARFKAQLLEDCGGDLSLVTEWLTAIGWLMPDEGLDDLPRNKWPSTKPQAALFSAGLRSFADGDEVMTHAGQPVTPYPPNDDTEPEKKPNTVQSDKPAVPADDHDAPWRRFQVPFGKDKGTPLGELNRKTLCGWCLNFGVTTEYNGKPKKAETVAKDREFRAALDEAQKTYGFKKKEGE